MLRWQTAGSRWARATYCLQTPLCLHPLMLLRCAIIAVLADDSKPQSAAGRRSCQGSAYELCRALSMLPDLCDMRIGSCLQRCEKETALAEKFWLNLARCELHKKRQQVPSLSAPSVSPSTTSNATARTLGSACTAVRHPAANCSTRPRAAVLQQAHPSTRHTLPSCVLEQTP